MTIRGSVQPIQMRSGNNLPVAGGRLVSSDGKNSVGFQLIAASSDAKQFDVVLNMRRGDDLSRATIAKVLIDTNVPFSLSLRETGKVTLSIAGKDFNADFIPISNGKGMVFCSTAQFKFVGVLFDRSIDKSGEER